MEDCESRPSGLSAERSHGKSFSKLSGLPCVRYLLIDEDRRACGLIDEDGISFALWMQNYAGYNSAEFVLEFKEFNLALAKANKIWQEWQETGVRSTWVA